jgi:hypothetical protein
MSLITDGTTIFTNAPGQLILGEGATTYEPVKVDSTGHMLVTNGTRTRITASKTRPADTNAYAVQDVINESTSAGTGWTFTSLGRINGNGGVIDRVHLVSSANPTTKLQAALYLFNAAPVADNDNAAFTPSDGELANLIGIVQFPLTFVGDATSGAGGNVVYSSGQIHVPYVCASDGTSLFGVLVALNAYTPVSAEAFTIMIQAAQD